MLAVCCAQCNKNRSPMLTQHEISDRIEIQDVLTEYCYAVDSRNWDAYRGAFTTDAVIDDTKTGGIKSGVEDHIAYMKKALSKILLSQHAISTILIKVTGDKATACTHCSCPMKVRLDKGGEQIFFQGLWYYDMLIRTPEGWKIKERREDGYWNYNVPGGFTF